MDYKKKKSSFAYMMWPILKNKENRKKGKRRGHLSGYNLNIIDGFLDKN